MAMTAAQTPLSKRPPIEARGFAAAGTALAAPASLALLIAIAPSALGQAADPPPPGPAAETVVVTANKLNVETLIDRTVYSVANDVQSSFGTVSDVLTAIPAIDVDSEGTVSLRGDTNVLILIDGKPSAMFAGASAGDNLQSIPAKDIERIEVITNPPAQYKAEGTAGIINIIMKKNRPAGLTGSVQGSLGSGGRSSVGGSASYQSGPLTASVTATFRQDLRRRLIQSDLLAPDPTSGQLTDNRSSIDETVRRAVPPVGLSIQYALSDRQSVSAELSRSGRAGLRTYTELNSGSSPPGTLTSSTERLSAGHDREVDYDAKLGFSQKFARDGEVLNLLLDRTASHENEHYDYTNESLFPPAATHLNNLGFHEDHGTTEFNVHYVLPFTKSEVLRLGVGFEDDKYDYGAVGYNIDATSGLGVLDPNLTDGFRYRQQISAAYVSYQAASGLWSWLGGLRAELTHTDGRQLTEGVSSGAHYLALFPSVHVSRAISDASSVSLGASRRISRPDPSSLDPYVDREYTPNLRAGNPDLQPQYTQSYEIGYAYQAGGLTANSTAYYRRNHDSVTDVTESLANGLSLTTRTNLPKDESAGLEFSANGRLVPQLAYVVSGNLFYSEIDATQLGAPGLKSTTGLNAKLKLDYRPTTADSAQLTVSRTGRRLTPQGYVSAINIVNVGYKRKFRTNLTAVLTVSDVFNGQRFERIAATPALTDDYIRFVRGRVAWFGVIYSFGVSRSERQPAFEYDE